MSNLNNHTIYLAGGCFWGVEEYFLAYLVCLMRFRVMPMAVVRQLAMSLSVRRATLKPFR